MKNKKKVKDEALSIIDAALAILNKYPELNTNETNQVSDSIATSLNPFVFLVELFKTTAGYDYLIRILAWFLTSELPIIENAVKLILLTNVKNMLSSCTLQPMITDELLRNGIAFSLPQIDILDTLKYSPLSKNGKHYYFGCSKCTCPDDVRDTAYLNKRSFDNDLDGLDTGYLSDVFFGTRDMNALLWYMKTRAGHREVWGRKLAMDDSGDSEADANPNKKVSKKSGIVTLSFSERPTSLLNAEGEKLSMEVPEYDILQVFIGNAMPKKWYTNYENVERNDATATSVANQLRKLRESIENAIKSNDERRTKTMQTALDLPSNDAIFRVMKRYDTLASENAFKLNKLMSSSYTDKFDTLWNAVFASCGLSDSSSDVTIASSILAKTKTYIETYNNWLSDIETRYEDSFIADYTNTDDLPSLTIAGSRTVVTLYDIERLIIACRSQNDAGRRSVTNEYRSVKQNYYHNRTVLEFNFDYIYSLKLFDERVIIAQLIDQLVKCSSVDMDLSLKQWYVREQTKELVNRIVTTDDAEVDDCFFAFSNDKYDEMMRKAELSRIGLYSPDGSVASPNSVDLDDISDMLNSLSSDASETDNQTVIEGVLKEVSGMVSGAYIESDGVSIEGNIGFNFIENLLDNLAYIIVSSVLSPKVYLLLLVNMKLMGENTNFTLEEFIAEDKKMLVAIIRQIRDKILEFLVKELQKLLGELAAQIAIKVGLEQAMYYKRLINRIYKCIKSMRGKPVDFNIDDAIVDIYNQEIEDNEEPLDDNCSAFK